MNKKALSLFALFAIILAGCTTKPNMNTVASKSGTSTSSHSGASTQTKISVSNPDNLAAPQVEIVKNSTWLGYAVKVTNTNNKPEFVRCYYEKDDVKQEITGSQSQIEAGESAIYRITKQQAGYKFSCRFYNATSTSNSTEVKFGNPSIPAPTITNPSNEYIPYKNNFTINATVKIDGFYDKAAAEAAKNLLSEPSNGIYFKYYAGTAPSAPDNTEDTSIQKVEFSKISNTLSFDNSSVTVVAPISIGANVTAGTKEYFQVMIEDSSLGLTSGWSNTGSINVAGTDGPDISITADSKDAFIGDSGFSWSDGDFSPYPNVIDYSKNNRPIRLFAKKYNYIITNKVPGSTLHYKVSDDCGIIKNPAYKETTSQSISGTFFYCPTNSNFSESVDALHITAYSSTGSVNGKTTTKDYSDIRLPSNYVPFSIKSEAPMHTWYSKWVCKVASVTNYVTDNDDNHYNISIKSCFSENSGGYNEKGEFRAKPNSDGIKKETAIIYGGSSGEIVSEEIDTKLIYFPYLDERPSKIDYTGGKNFFYLQATITDSTGETIGTTPTLSYKLGPNYESGKSASCLFMGVCTEPSIISTLA
jgi:hypothetical protein